MAILIGTCSWYKNEWVRVHSILLFKRLISSVLSSVSFGHLNYIGFNDCFSCQMEGRFESGMRNISPSDRVFLFLHPIYSFSSDERMHTHQLHMFLISSRHSMQEVVNILLPLPPSVTILPLAACSSFRQIFYLFKLSAHARSCTPRHRHRLKHTWAMRPYAQSITCLKSFDITHVRMT